MGAKLGSLQYGNNAVRGCLRTGCWG